MQSANYISQDFALLFKDKARVYCETADYLIGLKKEQRIEFRKAVLKKATDAEWTIVPDTPFKHHFLLQVKGE